MALKGLDIFKLTPKTNCKECGCPTCMAFSMKVAQGALPIEKCPHMSGDAMAALSEATAPPMKTIKVGTGEAEYSLGGETVLYRHEKTFVSKTRYAVRVNAADVDAKMAVIDNVDYDRIGERMHVEMVYVDYTGEADYAETVKKVAGKGKTIILGCTDVAAAKAALDVCAAEKPILNGATAANYAEMVEVAKAAGVVLGVCAANIDELYDTTKAIEELGYKELVLDCTAGTIKDTFATTVKVRRAALAKNPDRTCGYPSIVNVAALTADATEQCGLASLFTMKYGSIVVMDQMTYAEALPLFGLRQNVFTDPQKPMKVEPGIYPLNGADENSPCITTVDFALTYFLVSGELERSGVPVNLVISDAGGLSVLTAWAAGKLSGGTISKFFQENVESKVKSRKLIIPGKVAVLKGDIESKLPGWEIIIAPNEAAQLVKFLKDMKEAGEI